MHGLLLRISRSGTPLAGWDVVVDGSSLGVRTDARGAVRVQIDAGRHSGRVTRGGDSLDFDFVCAPGLVDLQVDLRQEETDLDDPSVMSAMPSDRYRPFRLLGEGAAGAVYKCRDVVLDRLVAVKLLNAEAIGGGNAREAFLAEARALARLEHDCLISIYDMGFKEDRAFLVTRFVDGPDLETVVESEGPLRLASLVVTGERLARALSAVHETGFVHLDVKPSNCLVDRRGRVFLGDFGLATHLENVVDQRDQVSGTPAYMAPELVLGMQVGPATDVYALGATLYHLATGAPPFVGHGPTLLRAHVRDPVVSLRERRPELPAWFDALVLSMLAKEPSARPSDRAVIDAFKGARVTGHDETLGAFEPRNETQQMRVRPLVQAWTRTGIPSLSSASVDPLGPGGGESSSGVGTLPVAALGSTRAMAVRRHRAPWARVGLTALALLLILGALRFFLMQEAPQDQEAVLVPAELPLVVPDPVVEDASPAVPLAQPPSALKASSAPSSTPSPPKSRPPVAQPTPEPVARAVSLPEPVSGDVEADTPEAARPAVSNADAVRDEADVVLLDPVGPGPEASGATEAGEAEFTVGVPESEDEEARAEEPASRPEKVVEPVLPPVSF